MRMAMESWPGVEWPKMAAMVAGLILTLLLQPATSYVISEVTDNPQRMWDPEKGSILGQDVIPMGAENVTVANKTAQLGTTTFLHCKVRNMADKQVSWLRRRDYHILSSGLHTYSRDERFSVVRPKEGDDWALSIRFVQKRDEGAYECQVSTKTGRYGYVVHLNVVVPLAVIAGSSELHVQSGSTISLLCTIHQSLTPPQFIFWYHNNDMINYDQSRGDVQVTMAASGEGGLVTSRLTINNAALRDSGNYSCTANNIQPSSVSVFVSEGKGDKTAAIQRLGSSAAGITASYYSGLCCVLFLLPRLSLPLPSLLT